MIYFFRDSIGLQMKKILFSISFLFLSHLFASELDIETKVKFQLCLGGEILDGYSIQTFKVRNDAVFVTIEGYDDKNKLITSNIHKLDDCIIADAKNWKCGGTLNQRTSHYDFLNQVIKGKFFYKDATYIKPDKGCKAFTVWRQL